MRGRLVRCDRGIGWKGGQGHVYLFRCGGVDCRLQTGETREGEDLVCLRESYGVACTQLAHTDRHAMYPAAARITSEAKPAVITTQLACIYIARSLARYEPRAGVVLCCVAKSIHNHHHQQQQHPCADPIRRPKTSTVRTIPTPPSQKPQASKTPQKRITVPLSPQQISQTGINLILPR